MPASLPLSMETLSSQQKGCDALLSGSKMTLDSGWPTTVPFGAFSTTSKPDSVVKVGCSLMSTTVRIALTLISRNGAMVDWMATVML